VRLISLATHSFRNLRFENARFAGARTAILGSNGVGKTSLLEAVAVLGNLRSFRTSNVRRMVRQGESAFRLAGVVMSGETEQHLEQRVEVGPPVQRTLLHNGHEVSVAQYLQVFPCFAVSGADRALVAGPPAERRALLDRFVFLTRPGYFDDLKHYRRALRQRNAALAQGAEPREMAAWEEPLAAAAARVVAGRRGGAEVISTIFAETYREIGGKSSPTLTLSYRGESWLEHDLDPDEVEVLYRRRYNETRVRDRQAGFTLEGPHRHDLNLRSDGREARYLLSSGQAKVVAASLRLATLAQLEKERREEFTVIVDDVDAELDRETLLRLLAFLGSDRQVLLSSTNKQVAETADGPTQRMWLDDGEFVDVENNSNE
jgi:DNA replication and repair protein RecF